MVFSVKSDFIGAEIAAQPYPNIRLFPIAQAAAWAPQPDVPVYNGSATPCWWPQNPPAQWWNMPYKCNTWQTAMPNVTDEFRCVLLCCGRCAASKHAGGSWLGSVIVIVRCVVRWYHVCRCRCCRRRCCVCSATCFFTALQLSKQFPGR